MGFTFASIKIFNYLVRRATSIRWHHCRSLPTDYKRGRWGIMKWKEKKSNHFQSKFNGKLFAQIVPGILIGFSSGTCQLITTRGQVIISQQWYAESVQSIQLPNEKRSIEEIYVMYKTCVCILQSKQLMQSLTNLEKLSEILLEQNLMLNHFEIKIVIIECFLLAFQIKRIVCWEVSRVACGNTAIHMENRKMWFIVPLLGQRKLAYLTIC